MKYTKEIVIHLPIEKVVQAYCNPDTFSKWQDNLISHNTIKGTRGEEGSVSVVQYQFGKKIIDAKETITLKKIPEEFNAIYESKNLYNEVRNKFIRIDSSKTRIICNCYFKLSGFLWVIGFFLPSSFQRQTEKMLSNFKDFVEDAKLQN